MNLELGSVGVRVAVPDDGRTFCAEFVCIWGDVEFGYGLSVGADCLVVGVCERFRD